MQYRCCRGLINCKFAGLKKHFINNNKKKVFAMSSFFFLNDQEKVSKTRVFRASGKLSSVSNIFLTEQNKNITRRFGHERCPSCLDMDRFNSWLSCLLAIHVFRHQSLPIYLPLLSIIRNVIVLDGDSPGSSQARTNPFQQTLLQRPRIKGFDHLFISIRHLLHGDWEVVSIYTQIFDQF